MKRSRYLQQLPNTQKLDQRQLTLLIPTNSDTVQNNTAAIIKIWLDNLLLGNLLVNKCI